MIGASPRGSADRIRSALSALSERELSQAACACNVPLEAMAAFLDELEPLSLSQMQAIAYWLWRGALVTAKAPHDRRPLRAPR